MKISCPSCRAAFALDDKRVPQAGLSIKCPKCKSSFTVHRPKPGEEGKLVEGRPTAVPLPAARAVSLNRITSAVKDILGRLRGASGEDGRGRGKRGPPGGAG